MKFQIKKFGKGFTLIELLVVISIIGLLSSIVLANLNKARAKGRDTARIQTVAQIKNALELYYSDIKSYPPSNDSTTVESLITPLTPYLKGLSPNFSIVGKTSKYLSKNTNYELIIPTETGGAFSKSIGCLSIDVAASTILSPYCAGNNPKSTLYTSTGRLTVNIYDPGDNLPDGVNGSILMFYTYGGNNSSKFWVDFTDGVPIELPYGDYILSGEILVYNANYEYGGIDTTLFTLSASIGTVIITLTDAA